MWSSAVPGWGVAATSELSALDGTNGFRLSGVAAGDLSGRAVSTAGDVNGDGVEDLLIGAYGADPNGSFSGASYVVFGQAPPDLAVSKTDSPDPVAVGDLLSYTVTVNNAGVGDATGVTLTDTLPASVTFASATPSQGSCGEAGLVVSCDLGDLGSGAGATVTIVVQPTATGTITNSVDRGKRDR